MTTENEKKPAPAAATTAKKAAPKKAAPKKAAPKKAAVSPKARPAKKAESAPSFASRRVWPD